MWRRRCLKRDAGPLFFCSVLCVYLFWCACLYMWMAVKGSPTYVVCDPVCACLCEMCICVIHVVCMFVYMGLPMCGVCLCMCVSVCSGVS